MGGTLATKLIRGPKQHRARSVTIPGFGRVIFTRDPGDATLLSSEVFSTNLCAHHFDGDGQHRHSYDLGSGLVTHAGVRLLSQDAAISAGAATLNVCKNHASGTGTTAAAALDTALQTAAAPTATTAVAGTNTNADASPNATVASVATITYGSSLAITEWGLFNQATLSGATMWDHKVFTAINVVNTDTIQFTYTLTVNSGG